MSHAGVLEQPDHEFVQAIQQRPVRYTYVILGVNVLIFLLMSLAGGTTNGDTLVAFGAKTNRTIDQGEIWRFLTPVFIHIGFIHLFANSYALWAIGPQVERLYGGARFVILYVAAGIAGVAASYQFNPGALSAGASGAIFGLFGVLLAFGLRHKNSIPAFYRQAVIRAVLPVIIINLLIGQTVPGIDNSAHIGGFLTGAALAFLITFERPGTSTSTAYTAVMGVAIFAVLLSFFQVYRHYNGPALSGNFSSALNPSGGTEARVGTFVDTLNNSKEAFEHSVRAIASRDLSRVAKARTETAAALDQLEGSPSIAKTPDKLIHEFLTLMRNQYALEQDVEKTGLVTFTHDQRASENARRFREIERGFREWIKTEGR